MYARSNPKVKPLRSAINQSEIMCPMFRNRVSIRICPDRPGRLQNDQNAKTNTQNMQINNRRGKLQPKNAKKIFLKKCAPHTDWHCFAFLGFAICPCGHLVAYLRCVFLHFGRFAVGLACLEDEDTNNRASGPEIGLPGRILPGRNSKSALRPAFGRPEGRFLCFID